MPTRPTNIPGTGWATNTSRRTALSSAQWGTGWVAGQPVGAKDLNDPIGQMSDWINYFQQLSLAEGTWTVIAGATTYGTLGYSTTSGSWLRLQANSARDGVVIEAPDTVAANTIQLRLDSTNAEVTVRGDPIGADTIWLKVKATGLVGPTAVASASTGIRYGYPSSSKQEVVYDVGLEAGGHQPCCTGSPGPAPVALVDISLTGVRLANAGLIGDCLMRLPLQFGQPTGQLSGFPVITSISGSFTGSADDLEYRVVRFTRSTGGKGIIATINASAPSNSFSHTVDTATYSYAVEVEAVGGLGALAATSDASKYVRLTVSFESLHPTV